MAGGNTEDLLGYCLDFCHLFLEKRNFLCEVTIGDTFKFRVNHSMEKVNISEKNTFKKYVSPSTRRRNHLHLLAYKAKRAAKGGNSPTRSGAPPPPNSANSGGEGIVEDLASPTPSSKENPVTAGFN